MYESVLKTATDDPNFKFKIRSIPYPPTYEVKIRYNGPNIATIIFLSSITYSMMITAVVSYLVVERINGLKHLQLVSGMQVQAYWISNFVFDFIKFQPTILTTLALFKIYDMKITAAWTVFLAFPFGILPFTYVSSFLFTEDGAAQTFTMFFHFLTLAILSSIAFALRLVPDRQ
jgi:ATP-binding cassette subfamily A (ABC1) protein 3